MKITITRRIYQIFFFLIFLAGLFFLVNGLVLKFPVKLILNFSIFNSITTILAGSNIAIGMLVGLVIAASTLFFGRTFCGWICPMGSIQHLGFVLFRHSDKKVQYKKNSFSKVQRIKFIILIICIVSALFKIVLSGYFDPLSLITRFFTVIIFPFFDLLINFAKDHTIAFTSTITTALLFFTAFLMNIIVPRFWCRVICPLGAILSLFSLKPLLHINRDKEKCIDCGQCREVCHGACDVDKELKNHECVMCMNCIDVCPVNAVSYRFPTDQSYKDNLNQIKLSRKDFIKTSVGVIGTIGIVKNYKIINGRGNYERIRPPGSLDENDFLERCIRCGNCLASCPTNVLQLHNNYLNLESLNTPILDMKYGYCEYECNNCSVACPTEAIRKYNIEDKHNKKYSKIGTAYFDKNRCLPWAFGTECLVCEEVCPVSPKAIYKTKISFKLSDSSIVELEAPVLDPQRCIGCGACSFHCPVKDLPAVRITSIGESRSANNRLLL